MRFIMKKEYDQDIRLFKYRSTFFWYLALVAGACLAPLVLNDYIISQLTFISIYSVAAVGLMLLTGYTGQVSMGHAAFFAIGSYTSAILTAKGVPFLLALPAAGVLAGVVGIIIGLPALRLSGLYLAIATMGFAFIVEEIMVRWESLTRGNMGMLVKPASIGLLLQHGNTLFLSRLRGADPYHPGGQEHPALPHGQGHDRHPRQRGGGAGHGHQPGQFQDHGLCRQRLFHRRGRQPVRP